MSDPSFESNVPSPLQPVAPPIPAQPLPVQSLQELTHEEPFVPERYQNFRRRPGIITAIAIISITVGSLGIFGGGLSALYGGIFYIMARATAAMTMPPTTATMTPSATTAVQDSVVDSNGNPAVEERGLDLSARGLAIDDFASHRPLNDARKRQLHALLAKSGQDILQSAGAVDVHPAISASGQLPRASDSDPNPGPDFFVIATGRIEVSDDRAIFEPADHSSETVRVSAQQPAVSADGGAIGNNGGDISRNDVQTAVQIVDLQTGHRLTSQQRKTLASEFSSSTGLFRPPPSGTAIGSELANTLYQPDGTVVVVTAYGELQVPPDGSVQFRYLKSGPNSTQVFTTAPLAVGSSSKAISGAAASMVVAEGAVSVLLSIYLLVVGILTLRQNPLSRRLHVIYALLKIPLAVLCGVGWYWIVGGFFTSMHAPGGSSQIQTVRAFLLIFMTGVAAIYPVALLITFCTPAVKRYYDSGLN